MTPQNPGLRDTTTLSVDDTSDVVTALQKRFPEIVGPGIKSNMAAAPQQIVKMLAMMLSPLPQALLVVGV